MIVAVSHPSLCPCSLSLSLLLLSLKRWSLFPGLFISSLNLIWLICLDSHNISKWGSISKWSSSNVVTVLSVGPQEALDISSCSSVSATTLRTYLLEDERPWSKTEAINHYSPTWISQKSAYCRNLSKYSPNQSLNDHHSYSWVFLNFIHPSSKSIKPKDGVVETSDL